MHKLRILILTIVLTLTFAPFSLQKTHAQDDPPSNLPAQLYLPAISTEATNSKLPVQPAPELPTADGIIDNHYFPSTACTSDLYQRISEKSVHTDDPLHEEHRALITLCNAEHNAFMAANPVVKSAALLRDLDPQDGMMNFETPHVHPIDLTPDGNTLLVVNIAAHALEIYDVSGGIAHVATIPVGLDPVSVRARNNNEAWVVNHISDSVSIVDLNQRTIVRTLITQNEPTDVVFAGSPQRAFVSCSETNSINVFTLSNLDASPQQVTIRGEDPRALAVSPSGQMVYAAIFESSNGTTNLSDADSSGNTTTLNPIVRKDAQGRWFDEDGVQYNVAGIGDRVNGWTLEDNDVAIINAQTLDVSYQNRLMTMVMAIDVNPATNEITVVGTESLNDITEEPRLNGIFVQALGTSFAPGGNPDIDDLNPHLDYTTSTVSASLRNQSIGDPRGIAWQSDGSLAFITGMGSNNVVVINQQGNRVDSFSVGKGPTGIVLDDSSNRGYVLNKFAGSISVFDIAARQEIQEVAFFDPTPAIIKSGRPFLYNTHLTSGLGQASCASCHVDARSDRLAWDLSVPGGAPFTVPRISGNGTTVADQVTISSVKGPMLTQTLQDIMAHPLLHWRGDRNDFSEFNGAFVSLMGAPQELSAAEMQSFGDFLDTIFQPPNPYRNMDDSRPSSVTLPDGRVMTTPNMNALRGSNATNNNCLACHYNGGTRNIGTSTEIASNIVASGFTAYYDRIGFRPDSRSGSTSGFGFFHDGGASLDRAARINTNDGNDAFLAEILTLEGPSSGLNGDERRKVAHAGVGQQVTINGTSTSSQNNRLNQFQDIASSSQFAALVAKAVINGTPRGFVYLGNNNYQSDRQGEQFTRTQLLNFAAAGDPVTFTLVAEGTETRIGIDRNLDGTLDGDEVTELTVFNPGDQQNIEGDSVSLAISAIDPQGDILTYSASSLPSGLSINSATGLISGMLNNNSVGNTAVSVTVSDSNGETDSASFAWRVLDQSAFIQFDFESDHGWVTNPFGTDTASTGQWERANPEQTSSNGNVLQLGSTTSGQNALVTEGTAGSSVGTNDIDSGRTSIRSPNIVLPNGSNVTLTFSYYLAHLGNATSTDFLRVSVIGSSTTQIFEELGSGDVDPGNWSSFTTDLSGFAGQTVNLLIEAADEGSGSLVEAAIDDVEVLIVSTNQPPSLTNPGSQTNLQGDSINRIVSASDADGDNLTFSATGLPNGLSMNSSGTIAGTTTNTGSFNVTVTVDDGNGGSDSASFTWAVNAPVNNPPILTNPGNQTNTVGDSVNLTVSASDADGDSLTFTAIGLPNGLSMSSNGTIAGTTTTAGSFNVTVTVDDDNGGSDSKSFTWTVNEGNTECGPLTQEAEEGTLSGAFTIGSDPAASNGSYIHVPESNGNAGFGSVSRATYCFTINEADNYRLIGSVYATDGSSDSFFVTVDGQPASGYTWKVLRNTQYASDTMTDNGIAVELPLSAGDHIITFYLREDGTRLDTITLESIGSSTNTPPTLTNPGSQTNTVGDSVTFALNASDADGDTLVFSASGLPNGLTLNSNTGQLTGSPSIAGSYNVVLSVSDGRGGSDSANFAWTVNADGTGCGSLSQEAESGELFGNFASTSDPVASGGAFVHVPEGSGNSGFGSANRAIFCFNTPEAGTYRLLGLVQGATGGSDSFFVTVNGSPVSGYLWDIDRSDQYTEDYLSDRNGDDPVELTMTAGEQTIVVYLREDGTRLDRLTLELVDGGSTNRPPSLTNPGGQSNAIGDAVQLSIAANDPDGDPLTFSASGLPTGLSMNNTSGQITGSPSAVGNYDVTVSVADDRGGSDSVSFAWVITDGNNACGGLDQEAEGGQLFGNMISGSDPAASNDGYIHVPDGLGNAAFGSTSRAIYCVTVAEAGVYRLRGLVYSADGNSDSFFVTVDDQPSNGYLWDTLRNTQYDTDFLSDRNSADPVELNLSAGDHTITIYLRDDGTRLDRLTLEPVSAGILAASTRQLDQQPLLSRGLIGAMTSLASANGLAETRITEGEFTNLAVTLIDAGDGKYHTSTDAYGRFFFDALPVGRYLLQIVVDGIALEEPIVLTDEAMVAVEMGLGSPELVD